MFKNIRLLCSRAFCKRFVFLGALPESKQHGSTERRNYSSKDIQPHTDSIPGNGSPQKYARASQTFNASPRNQRFRCPRSLSGHASVKAAKLRCCCNSHGSVFLPALRDIYFSVFRTGKSRREQKADSNGLGFPFTWRSWNLASGQGKQRVMQPQRCSRWKNRWCWCLFGAKVKLAAQPGWEKS